MTPEGPSRCCCSFPGGPFCPTYRELSRERDEARLDVYDAEDALNQARTRVETMLARQKLQRAQQKLDELKRKKKEHRLRASGPVPIPGGITG